MVFGIIFKNVNKVILISENLLFKMNLFMMNTKPDEILPLLSDFNKTGQAFPIG